MKMKYSKGRDLHKGRSAEGKNLKRTDSIMANEANMEKPGTGLKELTRDAEAMLRATAGQTGEKMNALRSRLPAAIDPAKATDHRPGEKTVAGAKVADKTIREHPYESIGIAAGVAFGLGLLMGVPAGRH
jgi:ElaB/YqjD/DUF883 family membrane-anchored ribosome-binding protein